MCSMNYEKSARGRKTRAEGQTQPAAKGGTAPSGLSGPRFATEPLKNQSGNPLGTVGTLSNKSVASLPAAGPIRAARLAKEGCVRPRSRATA